MIYTADGQDSWSADLQVDMSILDIVEKSVINSEKFWTFIFSGGFLVLIKVNGTLSDYFRFFSLDNVLLGREN